MKYKKIQKKLFVKNRKKFIKEVLPNSISLFYSSDFYNIPYDDDTLLLKKNLDLFYLCGLDEKQIILLILRV